MGGSACVAGSPSLTTAVGIKRLASTTAFVKWVVPIITAWICPGRDRLSSTRVRRTLTTPDVTSAVVGVFTSAITFWPSMRTASVLVPPTSIPIRIRCISFSRLKSQSGSFKVFGRDLAVGGAPARNHVLVANRPQHLLLLTATVLGKRATRSQPASRRWLDWRRHLAGQHQPCPAI